MLYIKYLLGTSVSVASRKMLISEMEKMNQLGLNSNGQIIW